MTLRGGVAGWLSSRRRALLLLGLLAVLVDLNALPGEFLADDHGIVVHNPLVARPDLGAIFGTDYWGGGFESGLYRPLTILSYGLNRLAFGPEPWSFHLVNVLLHAAAAVGFASTLFALGFEAPLALTAAGLFAVHPIHAEVVNVVAGRAELLVAAFAFWGLSLALEGTRRAWPLVLACYGAALLSKEHAVVFLPLLVAADAFAPGGPAAAWRRHRLLYALLAALTLGWLVLRRQFFEAAAAPLLIYASDNPLAEAALAVRLLTAAKVNLIYLANLAFPLRLQSVYSGPGLPTVRDVFSPSALVALAYLLLCAAAAFLGWRRQRAYALGIAAYFIAFSVTANAFFVITVLMADRFAYLPAAGFSLAAADLALLLRARASRPVLARLCLCASLLYVGFLGALTLARNRAFQHPEEFWKSVLRIDPQNVRAWTFLAQEASGRGSPHDAEQALLAAMRADPAFPDAPIAYGQFLLEEGRAAEAAEAALRAVELAPGGIGLAQFTLARAYVELQRPAEALALLDEISSIFESSPDYWSARGKSLESLGRAAEAAEAFDRAASLGGGPEARWRLALLLVKLARFPEGEEVIRGLLAENDTAAAHNLLGVALALQGKREDALRAFRAAVDRDPGSPLYRANLRKVAERSAPPLPEPR